MSARQRILVAALVAVSMTVGCKGREEGPFYRIEAPAAEVAAGAEGEVRIRFVAVEGYHWNEEYPAKFKVDDAGGLAVARKSFTKGDFREKNGVGSLVIAVKGVTVGEASLKGTASFSVCNPKECRILQEIRVEVPVRVR